MDERVDALSSEIVELKQVQGKLETDLRRRDEFFSLAAHELRNPLNALHLTLAGIIRAQSGGATLETLRVIGSTGVDFVSMGALTHSAAALDLSLTLEIAP